MTVVVVVVVDVVDVVDVVVVVGGWLLSWMCFDML